ncbi:hypothetical protein WJX81_002974 [Elliptochloris bilobata]|uniref:Exportin-T n=1 Tax=Elliptochloris bilobata TaxID=381761 RepID=A0AAW1R0Q4_9CHLO
MDQTDDFEKAVLFSFDQSGAVDVNIKAHAAAYCEEVRRSADCWQLCLQRFSASSFVEVRFWCLQMLHEMMRARYPSLEPEQRRLVKATVMAWMRAAGAGPGQQPPFLRNKIAQVLVCIVQVEFPEQWPTFFTELVALLGGGEGPVDMFCRVLVAIDEDVVSLDIPRSPGGVRASMALKDAMREHCLAELGAAWAQLVATYGQARPDLAGAVLGAVQRYVPWIDIGLVANDKLVPLLFALLGEGPPALAGAAADVLAAIVAKRMDAGAKLALVRQLGIIPLLAQWAVGLPGGRGAREDQVNGSGDGDAVNKGDGDSDGGTDGDDADELELKCAQLLATTAGEVLEAWKKVENGVVSLQAVGLSIDAEAGAEASAACAAATALIAELLPAVLAALRRGGDPALLLTPFLQAFAGKLKGAAKRTGGLPETHVSQLRALMEAVVDCARFPADALLHEANSSAEPADSAAAAASSEALAVVAERRQELFVLFRAAARVAPGEAYAVTGRRLAAALATPSTSPQEVEVAITLLYQLGEGAPEETLKPGSGALGQMAAGLMGADVPAGAHPLVAAALLETVIRYLRVLQQQPACLPRVLALFLGSRGMGHPDAAVAMRVCYLFARLVKALRSELRPLLQDVLAGLQPHLSRIVAEPAPDKTAPVGGKVPPAGKSSQGAAASATDDRLYAFEAAGLLVGGDDLPEAQQVEAAAALLRPLLARMEAQLPAAAAGAGTPGGRAAAAAVLQALEAVARVSRGFSLALTTRRPALGDLLAAPLVAAIRIPGALPGNRVLRGRVISFLHRMVECLGERLLGTLPAALAALLPAAADAGEVSDVAALLQQLATRFRAVLLPLLVKVVPEVVARVHALLPADWDWSGAAAAPPSAVAGVPPAAAPAASEEAREAGDMQRAYYALLLSLATNQLAPALLQAPGGALDAALEALLRGAASHVDPVVRRMCVQALRRLLAEVAAGPAPPPGFQQFLLERVVGGVCVGALATGRLDARDAAVAALLGDLAGLLADCAGRCGDGLGPYLRQSLLPALPLPPALQETLLRDIEVRDVRALKASLRAVVLAAPGAPPNSRVRSSAASAGRQARAATPSASADSGGMVS